MKHPREFRNRALLWAFGISFLVFILFSSVFLGNLGPIPALVYSPIAFVASFIVFWIVETLLASATDLTRKVTYLVLCVILLAPVVAYIGINHRDFTRTGRMEHAPPLTDEERLLVQATRLNLRIGVANPSRPPVYTRSLISDLQETCLFQATGEIEKLEKADVVATITGAYWDDKTGFRFILHPPEQLKEGVEIKIFYKLGLSIGNRDHRQYIDRLSVELIKASQTLFDQGKLVSTDILVAKPDAETGCRRN